MHFSKLPYLDPGSGSFIIQILIASLLGIGLMLRAFWGKIMAGFRGKAKPGHEDDDLDND